MVNNGRSIGSCSPSLDIERWPQQNHGHSLYLYTTEPRQIAERGFCLGLTENSVADI